MISSRYASMTNQQDAGRTAAQCAASCPVCGGLECLCRPRFFAGQLLSEEDLNRLDRYITGKNRLHNRMLFGWGVVNGLEASCGPRKDQVVVSAGYALSPCGDDIVVCKETTVDICKLANDCCDRAATDCGPYAPVANADCQEVEQKWILAICYDETPSRGVTPLRNTGAAACCSRCNCGGSSACGCGCHEKQPSRATRQPVSRGQGRPAAQCEPTVICEGYRFALYQPEKPKRQDTVIDPRRELTLYAGLQGELAQRFTACVRELAAVVGQIQPPDDANVDELYAWCCAVKQAFADFLADTPGAFCNLNDLVNQFRCPDPARFANDTRAYRTAIGDEIGKLIALMSRGVYACLCSALLPPVPVAPASNCVPLATVTIRRRDCKVISVCNFEGRKFAITFTNLAYWLSPLESFVDRLRQSLSRLCCAAPRFDQRVPIRFRAVSRAGFMRRATFAGMRAETPADTVDRFERVWARRAARKSDPRAFILDALGLARDDGELYLTPIERDNPAQTLLFDQLLGPFVEGLAQRTATGEEAAEAAQPAAEAGPEAFREAPAGQPGAFREELAALRAQLDELTGLVSRQASEIARLQKGWSRGRARPEEGGGGDE